MTIPSGITRSNTATIPVGTYPSGGVGVSPDSSRVCIPNPPGPGPGGVSVIDTVTNTVIDSIVVGLDPYGIAVTPDGQKVLVANQVSGGVSVIDTETNMVTATCPASCARSSASAW